MAHQYRELKVKWPAAGITVTVRMHNKNKALVDLLWDTLPYRSLQTHALVTGDHLYHLVPSEALIYTPPALKIPDRTEAPDGTVFLSSFQHLAIKYGPVTEHHPAAPCGNVIPEDIEKLRSVGDQIWKGQLEKKQPFQVVLWDASQPEPDDAFLSLRLQRTGVTEEVKELVKEIHDKACVSKRQLTCMALLSNVNHWDRQTNPGLGSQMTSTASTVVRRQTTLVRRTRILLLCCSPTAKSGPWATMSLIIYSKWPPTARSLHSNILLPYTETSCLLLPNSLGMWATIFFAKAIARSTSLLRRTSRATIYWTRHARTSLPW
ncbi:predicted protein [Aspergillus terreus NIH2624]|uniref:Uncharacterized protein n=1 Tax=Aspergillus terreus (strain NIH 2624 / FGSC A1156) TaxID=341663 RepID=Q0CJD2_ASPTN|nr:uncharacterized protein ATEG_06202 [Aspergillus terreus NIH2624]EAU33963.1 predicted protein [Aspergillus terreus NIH2624]